MKKNKMKNIGILGPGNIAQRVAKGILCSPVANLYAAASRDEKKAEAFAEKFGAEKFYGSYEQMLEDEKVDIVYICTPNAFHYDQIKLCISHGKHVICEKPMVENQAQVKELFAMARAKGCFLMEAEKTMFTPLNTHLKALIETGMIGKLLSVRAEYSSDVLESVEKTHWVLTEDMSGCSYDIGVYPISFSHFFAGAKMSELKVQSLTHPEFACDFGMQADIRYENGVYGFLQSSWFYTPEHKGSAILAGETGYIEVPAYWKGTKAYLHQDGRVKEISVEMESDFEGEITHAVQCIEQGLLESPILGEAMSLEIIRIVEEVQMHKNR